MLRAVPMMHLRVQVPNRDAAAITRCVAREGLLHLIDLAHGRVPGLAAPPQAAELLAAFRDLATRIRSIARRIGADLPELAGGLAGSEQADFAEERERIEAELRPLEKSVEASWRALLAAREDRAKMQQDGRRSELLARAGLDAGRLRAVRYLAVRIALGGEEDAAALGQLLAASPFLVLPLAREGDRWLFAVAGPRTAGERMDASLRAASCEPIPLADAPDPAALERCAQAEARAVEELAAAKNKALPVLGRLLPRAESGALLLQAQTHFAASGRFVVLSGWVPARDAERLRKSLEAATGGRAVVDLERPEDLPAAARAALGVPILHRNPLLLRPFQGLVRLYGTPSYEEVEPTAFFAISFLLMFGLMFGDVGHGFVLFAAGFCLFRFLPRFLDYGILLMEGGAASMIFGVLYGSVFGLENVLPALWLRPIEDLSRFMIVAASLGAFLVSAGLILGVVNLWRAGKRDSALFGSKGLFGAFLYWVMLVLVVRWLLPQKQVLPVWVVIALGGAAASLLLLRPLIVRKLPRREPHAPGPGWVGALEASVELVDGLFSLFTNTISFVRIAAFAAVHAGISLALFALIDTLAQLRFGGALSLLALVAGNAVAILLEGLTVSVQVLRLEYYEFFTRFFRGGGEPFRPLMLGRQEKGEAS
ncbi:MAG TPA: V-type ATPase 116kDa subunit family protein [Myxococcales bacterium]|nr:V-type ATPase 116kDa subunit family protein [Myxococcales bacterium]